MLMLIPEFLSELTQSDYHNLDHIDLNGGTKW